MPLLVSREQIEGFLLGQELAEEVVHEIDRGLDDPDSEVSRLCREYSQLTRLIFDPGGPLFCESRSEGADREIAGRDLGRDSDGPEQRTGCGL
ncbi:MAG TPA: hypothetical protein VMV10_16415 [Pirellulales bacterium]|nr:hypothetical protein [Pirellulales bacterium]